jgi:hypothetical protein
MTIRVHIERLVLEGLPVERRQGPLIRQAVETELGRLLAGVGGMEPALKSGGAFDRLTGATVALGPAPEPKGVGQQIARAVYWSLTS